MVKDQIVNPAGSRKEIKEASEKKSMGHQEGHQGRIRKEIKGATGR